jgi:hypothetical protein
MMKKILFLFFVAIIFAFIASGVAENSTQENTVDSIT